jgi:hypothetical protein
VLETPVIPSNRSTAHTCLLMKSNQEYRAIVADKSMVTDKTQTQRRHFIDACN